MFSDIILFPSIGKRNLPKMKMNKLIIIMLFLETFGDVVRAALPCPKQCKCLTYGLVSCKDKPIENDQALLEITQTVEPMKTKFLALTNNKLKSFKPEYFVNFTRLIAITIKDNLLTQMPKKVNYFIPTVIRFSVYNNKVKELREEDFEGYEKVETLSLRGNQIEQLEPNVFQHLTNVKLLNLDLNKISILKKGIFNGMNNLQTIQLNSNQIKSIETGVFDNYEEIEIVKLSRNKLNSIQAGVFSKVHIIVHRR